MDAYPIEQVISALARGPILAGYIDQLDLVFCCGCEGAQKWRYLPAWKAANRWQRRDREIVKVLWEYSPACGECWNECCVCGQALP